MNTEPYRKPGLAHRIFDAAALLALIITLVSAVESCSNSNVYRADHGVPPCEITAAFDSIFTPMLPADCPGAIVTVMRGDSIVYNHAYGLARLDSVERVTDSTIFNISSASKLVTGVAIMKLVENGQLSLDDSLSKFFPEFPRRYFDRIKVRHVLSHTSGLPDLRPTNRNEWMEYLERNASTFGFDRDYRLYGTEREHMQTFVNLDTMLFEPGTHYDRRDISYILIAPLIERVTGQKFGKWMKANIFDPAGMTESFYYQAGMRTPRMAHGYRQADTSRPEITFRSSDGRWDEYDYNESEYFLTKADRGVFCSSRDFMRFRRALANNSLISAESLETILTPVTDTGIPYVGFGVSTAVATLPDMPRKSYHLNQNGGFSVITCWWPDKDVSYLVFCTRNDIDQRPLMAKVDSIIASVGWLD